MPLQIASLIEEELQRVEESINEHLECDVSFISDIARYVLSSGGKRIRPVLLILSARACHHEGDRIYDLSVAIEFIHTATLLHDDVIDNSHLRRGQPTVHSRWGNEISILIGDYLYSKAMALSLADGDHLVMQTISDVTMEMAKGQIVETLKQRDLGIREEDYFHIIALKTASLFTASCTIGALVGGVSPSRRTQIAAFGRHLGMAFQIADDTLDFVALESRLGKPIYNDLKEGKITLPLIMAVQQANAKEVQVVADYLHNTQASEADLQEVIAILHKYDTLQASMLKAHEHVAQAKHYLRGFEPSPALETLYKLADYVVSRDI